MIEKYLIKKKSSRGIMLDPSAHPGKDTGCVRMRLTRIIFFYPAQAQTNGAACQTTVPRLIGKNIKYEKSTKV